MTVAELTTVMLREWSEAADDTDKLSLMRTFIQNSIDEFASLVDYRVLKSVQTITTVASQAEYTLNVNVRHILAMRITSSNQPIEQVTAQQVLMSTNNLSETGTPSHWYYSASGISSNQQALKIKFYRVPDAIYSIEAECIIAPNNLSSSDVIPVMTEHLHIIMDKIRCFMYTDDKDYEAADRADARFMNKVGAVINRENKRPAQRRRLRVSDLPDTRDRFVRPDGNHFPRSGF